MFRLALVVAVMALATGVFAEHDGPHDDRFGETLQYFEEYQGADGLPAPHLWVPRRDRNRFEIKFELEMEEMRRGHGFLHGIVAEVVPSGKPFSHGAVDQLSMSELPRTRHLHPDGVHDKSRSYYPVEGNPMHEMEVRAHFHDSNGDDVQGWEVTVEFGGHQFHIPGMDMTNSYAIQNIFNSHSNASFHQVEVEVNEYGPNEFRFRLKLEPAWELDDHHHDVYAHGNMDSYFEAHIDDYQPAFKGLFERFHFDGRSMFSGDIEIHPEHDHYEFNEEEDLDIRIGAVYVHPEGFYDNEMDSANKPFQWPGKDKVWSRAHGAYSNVVHPAPPSPYNVEVFAPDNMFLHFTSEESTGECYFSVFTGQAGCRRNESHLAADQYVNERVECDINSLSFEVNTYMGSSFVESVANRVMTSEDFENGGGDEMAVSHNLYEIRIPVDCSKNDTNYDYEVMVNFDFKDENGGSRLLDKHYRFEGMAVDRVFAYPRQPHHIDITDRVNVEIDPAHGDFGIVEFLYSDFPRPYFPRDGETVYISGLNHVMSGCNEEGCRVLVSGVNQAAKQGMNVFVEFTIPTTANEELSFFWSHTFPGPSSMGSMVKHMEWTEEGLEVVVDFTRQYPLQACFPNKLTHWNDFKLVASECWVNGENNTVTWVLSGFNATDVSFSMEDRAATDVLDEGAGYQSFSINAPPMPYSCAPGMYCKPGMEPKPCPLGHFCPADTMDPMPCEAGTFMPAEGASRCRKPRLGCFTMGPGASMDQCIDDAVLCKTPHGSMMHDISTYSNPSDVLDRVAMADRVNLTDHNAGYAMFQLSYYEKPSSQEELIYRIGVPMEVMKAGDDSVVTVRASVPGSPAAFVRSKMHEHTGMRMYWMPFNPPLRVNVHQEITVEVHINSTTPAMVSVPVREPEIYGMHPARPWLKKEDGSEWPGGALFVEIVTCAQDGTERKLYSSRVVVRSNDPGPIMDQEEWIGQPDGGESDFHFPGAPLRGGWYGDLEVAYPLNGFVSLEYYVATLYANMDQACAYDPSWAAFGSVRNAGDDQVSIMVTSFFDRYDDGNSREQNFERIVHAPDNMGECKFSSGLVYDAFGRLVVSQGVDVSRRLLDATCTGDGNNFLPPLCNSLPNDLQSPTQVASFTEGLRQLRVAALCR